MNPHKALLLRLIQARSDVSALIEEGLTYVQISQLLGEAVSEGLVRFEPDGPSLTTAGLESIQRAESGVRRSDGGFISPMTSQRVDRLPVDAIYLPPKRFSYF